MERLQSIHPDGPVARVIEALDTLCCFEEVRAIKKMVRERTAYREALIEANISIDDLKVE